MILTPVTAPNAPVIVYSDVNLHLNENSQYDIVYDATSIQNSITTILSTRIGTRPFRRDFGSTIDPLLFDPMDDITVQSLKSEIKNTIGKWETRIVLVNVVVKPVYEDQQYYVLLEYVVPGLNNKSATFAFNLAQGS